MSFYKRPRISGIKKAISIPLALAVFCGASVCAAEIPPVPAPTQSTYSAMVNIPVTDFVIGDLVYVNIATKPQASAYGFELFLDYDSDKLEYKTIEINGAASDGIIKITNENGRLCIAATAVGGSSYEDNNEDNGDNDGKNDSKDDNNEDNAKQASELKGDELCSVVFAAKAAGKCEFALKSFKLVFDDMTYFSDADISVSATAEIKDPKEDKEDKEDKRSSGGGRGGGGISIGGKTSATTAPVPEKPDISNNAENNGAVNDKNNVETISFSDIDKSHWAYESVMAMAKHGIINGFEDKTFRPDLPVTRAEFAKMICTALKIKTDITNAGEFSDVSVSDWFYNEVMTLKSVGIVNGSNGEFMPNEKITREDAAVIAKRGCDYCGLSLDEKRQEVEFADRGEVSDYAKEAIKMLCMSEILNGSDDNSFEPKSDMTRAQAAAITERIKTVIENGEQGV